MEELQLFVAEPVGFIAGAVVLHRVENVAVNALFGGQGGIGEPPEGGLVHDHAQVLLRVPETAANGVGGHPGKPPLEHLRSDVLHKDIAADKGGAVRHCLPAPLPGQTARGQDLGPVLDGAGILQTHGAVVAQFCHRFGGGLIAFIEKFGIPTGVFGVGQRGDMCHFDSSFLVERLRSAAQCEYFHEFSVGDHVHGAVEVRGGTDAHGVVVCVGVAQGAVGAGDSV